MSLSPTRRHKNFNNAPVNRYKASRQDDHHSKIFFDYDDSLANEILSSKESRSRERTPVLQVQNPQLALEEVRRSFATIDHRVRSNSRSAASLQAIYDNNLESTESRKARRLLLLRVNQRLNTLKLEQHN